MEDSKPRTIHEVCYVVISAHQPENDKTENAKLQASLLADLLDLVGFCTSVIPTTGRYLGVEEESFAIPMTMEVGCKCWNKIQEGLIRLGNKYNQFAMLIVYGDNDPPTCTFFPLDRAIEAGMHSYKEHPWIEIDCEECENLDPKQGLTRVMDKCFIADESNDVTPPEFKIIEEMLEAGFIVANDLM